MRVRTLLAAAVMLSLSACTSSADGRTPSVGQAPAVGPTVSRAGSPAVDGDNCTNGGDAIKALTERPDVQSVQFTDVCGVLIILTKLGDSEVKTATQICTLGARAADIDSVDVLAKSGKDLATDVTGAPCTAAP